MGGLFEKYNQRLQHEHGWALELECKECGKRDIPEYRGWTPNLAIKTGSRPTIFANLVCKNCAKNLKEEAEEKIIETFSALTSPPQNKKIIFSFIAILVGLPLLLGLGIFIGAQLGLWTYRALVGVSAVFIFLGPAILWFNWQIAGIRHHCSCGQPAYLFMGMLGRSYCYRCSSCGNLLRLRD